MKTKKEVKKEIRNWYITQKDFDLWKKEHEDCTIDIKCNYGKNERIFFIEHLEVNTMKLEDNGAIYVDNTSTTYAKVYINHDRSVYTAILHSFIDCISDNIQEYPEEFIYSRFESDRIKGKMVNSVYPLIREGLGK